MLGTGVNCLVIIVGCIIGLLVRGKISNNISKTVMNGLGLCVLYIGIDGALKGNNSLLAIFSVAIGAVIGEIIDFDKKIGDLGEFLELKLNTSNEKGYISKGFVTASLLFCVGAMSIVGALESGLTGNHSTLYAKSMLDGISSIIFTSSLGIGVMLSAVTVLVYQGTITIAAGILSGILSEAVILNITSIGSILIVGLALNVLGVTKIKIANLLPAMFIPIILEILSLL